MGFHTGPDIKSISESLNEKANNSISATIVVIASDSKANIKSDYKCTGINDDIVIQSALNALPSNGGKVLLTEGTYNISNRLVLPSYCILEGMGEGTRLIAQSGLNLNYCMIGDSAIPTDNITSYNIVIRNLTVDLNNQHTCHGIWFRMVNDGVIERVHIKNTDNLSLPQPPLPRGSAIDIGAAAQRGLIINCIGENNNNTQGSFGNNSTRGNIIGCTSINSYIGIFGDVGSNIKDCVVQGGSLTTNGIYIAGASNVSNCTVTDVTVSGGAGIFLSDSFTPGASKASNNYIKNCYYGINLVANNSFADSNHIIGATNKAITGASATGVVANGNFIIDSQRGIDIRGNNCTVNDNIINDTRGTPVMDYGIQFVGNTGIVVMNNRVFNAVTSKIALNSGASAIANINNN